MHPVDTEIDHYEIDQAETKLARDHIRANRRSWLEADPAEIAERYRTGELAMLDLIRRYGVIVDWGSGELFPTTTRQFREMLHTRMVKYWH